VTLDYWISPLLYVISANFVQKDMVSLCHNILGDEDKAIAGDI